MKNKNTFSELLNKKLEDVGNLFNVKLNPDDPKLIDQLTLGDRWDDPSEVSKALDMQPLWNARWASILRELKNEHNKRNAIYKVWESDKKSKLREILISRNSKKGLTDRQARVNVTQSMVEEAFNIKYNSDNKNYNKYHKPLEDLESQIDKVQLVVDAFKQRKDTLVTLAYLVKSMIENSMINISEVQKKKFKKHKKNNNG